MILNKENVKKKKNILLSVEGIYWSNKMDLINTILKSLMNIHEISITRYVFLKN